MVTLTIPIVAVFVLRGVGAATELLMLRRLAPPVGTWAQVSGEIEDGETAWQAALRETREETGLVPDSLWSADCHEMFYEPARDAFTIAPCFVARVAPAAEPVLNAEHDAAAWLSFDDALAAVSFAGQRRVLRAIREEFVDHDPHPDQRCWP
ncbi:NUDIX hydrolase [Jannaschia seohaensis]|uniref:dATP pyrophosphohydrolase n=1 Tax=Jannaschia seohaensis TaxID=475081 RepID=A0A2Y9AU58_9RHOB|nr:NUDIX domain-containing protein [Jannaschia seohaensis]PWJ19131.1 dATP pyrophosphohydrolase [Jannaschia seohaensis]SSA45779.1 dATP pyrophosphohydrolase [Jannaschia seohaensis]